MALIEYDLSGGSSLVNNVIKAGSQRYPEVAALPSGGFLAVWAGPPGSNKIQARVYYGGLPQGDEFTLTAGGSERPVATALTNGNVLVAYSVMSGSTFDIRGMLVSSTGVPSASDFAISVDTTDDFLSGVAALPGGGFLVVYTRNYGNRDVDVRGRIFNASGTQVGSDIAISSNSSTLASFSGTPTATASGFVVAWIETTTSTSGGPDSVWLRRYSASGAPLEAPVLVEQSAPFNSDPQVLQLADGGFVLAYRSGSTDGSNPTQVKVRVYNSDGSQRAFVTATPNSAIDYFNPLLAQLPNGGFVVSFQQTSATYASFQLYSSAGIALGSKIDGLQDQFDGSLTMVSDGAVEFLSTASSGDGDSSAIRETTYKFIRYTTGDSSSETLVGDELLDYIDGAGGNDILIGRGGEDLLLGGSGIDTAIYSGVRSNYVASKNQSGGFELVDVRAGSPDGHDYLIEVERIGFSGAVMSLETFTPRNFNGDLKSDLAWYNDATGSSVVFLMNGLTSTSGVVVGPANGAAWDLVATGDLNGDGQSDMIWQNTSGQVVGYIMNGTSIASAAVIGSPGASFRVVGVGDLNADGSSDIILQDGNGQAVAWLMNSTTIQSAVGIGPANGAAWSIKAVGDLNGDSRADLVWQNTDGSTVGYIMNGGSIVAANQIGGALGANWSVKGIGDMNGDFAADIIWQYSNGQAGVWLMNGTSIAAAQGIGGANGSQFEIRDIADLNGDARMDLVWENMSTGQAVGFLMNGSTILAAANIGGANGADWKIV